MRAIAIAVALIAGLAASACSGKSARAGATASFGGGQQPKPGSLLGSWTVQHIDVLNDSGRPHPIRAGSPVRIANEGVRVIGGIYVGESASRRFLVEQYLGGRLELTSTIHQGTFELEIVTDYSPWYLPPRSVYERLYARGELSGSIVRIYYLLQSFQPRRTPVPVEIERDELMLLCIPGPPIEPVSGLWQVRELETIEASSRPHGIGPGALLEVFDRRVVDAFGTPFDPTTFERTFPGFRVVVTFTEAFDGIVQGFLLALGESNTAFAGHARIVLFDLVQAGPELYGYWFLGRTTAIDDLRDQLLLRLDRKE